MEEEEKKNENLGKRFYNAEQLLSDPPHPSHFLIKHSQNF